MERWEEILRHLLENGHRGLEPHCEGCAEKTNKIIEHVRTTLKHNKDRIIAQEERIDRLLERIEGQRNTLRMVAEIIKK